MAGPTDSTSLLTVDTHTHVIPSEFVDCLRAGDAPPGMRLVERPGEDPMIAHESGLQYPVHSLFDDPRAKLDQMDRDGIDISLISVSPTLFPYWSGEEALRAARLLNDATGAFAEAGGKRLAMIATAPMCDPMGAAEELRRAHDDLGAVGVQVGTSVGDLQLDDASFDPFFDTAAELGMPVLLHPYLSMIWAPPLAERGFHLGNVAGNPHDTFLAAARLIVGGRFDRNPELRVQLVHGGGSLPYQLGRLTHAYEARADTRGRARRLPTDYLENLLFDTVVFEPVALDFLLARVGAERVLLGTDIPFDMADRSLLSDAGDHLDPDSARAILGENAVRAYSLGT